MLILGVPSLSSPIKELYDPRAFFTHAALLHQSFLHCAIFPTATSRRSLDRVSVPVWRIVLSNPLPIVALVRHYHTNKLMGRRLIHQRRSFQIFNLCQTLLSGISSPFEKLSQTEGQIVYALLTRAPL